MAARLRSKPCEFGKVYGTQILGRPDEILSFLKTLPGNQASGAIVN
jgi:hypothetical protein